METDRTISVFRKRFGDRAIRVRLEDSNSRVDTDYTDDEARKLIRMLTAALDERCNPCDEGARQRAS